MKHPHLTIESWLDRAPEWAKQAYHNDSTFHKQLFDCAHHEASTEEMLWRLAGMFYEQRNYWRETYIEARKHDTHTIVFPSKQTC